MACVWCWEEAAGGGQQGAGRLCGLGWRWFLRAIIQVVYAACISADSRRSVSVDDDSLVKVWDLESKTCLATLEGHNAAVKEAALSADGKLVLSATFMGVMRVWQLSV